jgi:histidinol-phosphate/aromatic aminotransferase/cobyric acid decarboxylase-like protein
VVGSLTKLFACPGLRVGYLLAPPDIVERVRLRQPEWSVNALACAVLPALLDRCDLPRWSQSVADLRAQLVAILGRAGLDPEPSDAPFVLARDASGLRDHLALQGVLVRDTGSFGIADGVRIAVPSSSGLDRLTDALEGWKR